MSPLSPAQLEQLQEQRRVAKRAMAQGRRWYLRSVLMMLVAIVAAYRGAQINDVLAIVMVILAGVSWSMGRSMRRGAKASLEKIDLMDKPQMESSDAQAAR